MTSRPEAFDDDECAWLETIGRHIGAAIAAVRRRNLLLSDRVAELEIVCKDSGSFFVETSRSLGCRFELETLVPVAESTQLYYVRLEGSSPAEVFERAEATEGIADCPARAKAQSPFSASAPASMSSKSKTVGQTGTFP